MSSRTLRMVTGALASFCVAAPLAAQAADVGLTSSTFRPGLGYVYETGGASRQAPGHSWLRSIVLWRWQPKELLPAAEEAAVERDALRQYRRERDAAQDAGRIMAGGNIDGVVYSASADSDGTLHVLGRRYVVPSHDSALVIMVDQMGGPGSAPRVVGTAYISGEMPDAFWPRSWMRGDTTLSLPSGNTNDLLLAALRKSPAVAAFIHGAP